MKSILSPSKNLRGAALTLGSFASLVHMAAAVPTTSYNTGSLGKPGDGASTTGVVVDQPGAITAYQDFSSSYSLGDRTEIPFRPELNPASGSPFTIEFWAKPTASDDADAPIGNRLGGSVNRSGWVFFQRASGWNLRMYNGNGTQNGWDITAGPAPLNVWTHVVAVWSGTEAKLFINGAEATTTNNGPGGYNANTTEMFRVGALIGGDNGYAGAVDEVAFYSAALTPTQISNHYTTASSTVPGAYSSMVKTDGAVLYLQQNPPTANVEVTNWSPLATKVSFTGILAQSTDLTNWTDLTTATSPYTPASPQPGKLFFRAHR